MDAKRAQSSSARPAPGGNGFATSRTARRIEAASPLLPPGGEAAFYFAGKGVDMMIGDLAGSGEARMKMEWERISWRQFWAMYAGQSFRFWLGGVEARDFTLDQFAFADDSVIFFARTEALASKARTGP